MNRINDLLQLTHTRKLFNSTENLGKDELSFIFTLGVRVE